MAEALPTATAFGRVQAGSKTMEPPSDEDDAAVVGELVGGLPLSAFHIRLWLVCAISYGACGSTGALLPWLIASMREQLHLDVVQEGAISSCIYWGMMVGSVVGGQLADEVGRRRAVIGCLALLTLLQLSLSALSSTLLIGASFFMRGMVYIAVENVSKAQLAECVPSARRSVHTFNAHSHTANKLPSSVRVQGLAAKRVTHGSQGDKLPRLTFPALNPAHTYLTPNTTHSSTQGASAKRSTHGLAAWRNDWNNLHIRDDGSIRT
ncbi:hypothetical protein T492DRAFT_832626 [Pavlovales sp. CCMP2436]|nr:hypothetical protein T492DRAFT_832626 [Pavlovales sp. CCMP2436]